MRHGRETFVCWPQRSILVRTVMLRQNAPRVLAPLFYPFFSGKTEKNGPPEAQLRYYRILPHAGACRQPLRQNLRFCHLPLHRGGFGRTASSAPTGAAVIAGFGRAASSAPTGAVIIVRTGGQRRPPPQDVSLYKGGFGTPSAYFLRTFPPVSPVNCPARIARTPPTITSSMPCASCSGSR